MIFCQPRHVYKSYSYFWQIVGLCDYEIIYIDEIDVDSDEVYIVISPDMNLEWPNRNATIIFWLLEWYADYFQHKGVSRSWCVNKTLANMVDAEFVPIGSHAGLGERHSGGMYDVGHMSYDAPHRRSLMLNKMRELGISIAPNEWDDTRHETLCNTRAIVHIHQDEEYPALSPLRVSMAAAYGLPVISEVGWSIEPYNDIVITHEYDTMHLAVKHILASADLQYYGDALHNLLCNELRFDKVVEANV